MHRPTAAVVEEDVFGVPEDLLGLAQVKDPVISLYLDVDWEGDGGFEAARYVPELLPREVMGAFLAFTGVHECSLIGWNLNVDEEGYNLILKSH